MQEQFFQLEDVLQAPIAQLDDYNQAATLQKAKQLLNTSTQSCIVVATSTSNHKLQNIKTLYRSMVALKILQRKLCNEYPSLHTSLIGIYPSLEYPACVYELNTNADRYVSANVLPYTGSALISTVKYLIDKFLGANPAVGGLGLTLYKE
tara:strand:+ start:14672 stop:15121 length:450 start_codon:yes stop_codon:yes gene_type:complete